VTLKTCKKCGEKKDPAEFYRHKLTVDKLNPWCKECCRADCRRWRKENPDKKRAASKRWGDNNRARCRKNHREWCRKNPQRIRADNARRRARMLGAPGFCTPEQLSDLIAYYNERCYLCGAPYEVIDHVIPLSRGGTNWPSNLRPACNYCNNKKHASLPSESGITSAALAGLRACAVGV